ncbi:MAG: hypothetical protein IPN94_16035 [Sphingobacteriales bacterium]|nr:hypothetical protein [Sphingobacteriales bacterium]
MRVSGVVGRFGKDQGTVCIKKQRWLAPIAPNNDVCSGAIDLTLNATNCTNGSNRNANMETPIPTRNNRSRSSIWYKFVAPAGGRALIETQANFADVIAVYSGNCNTLTEIASNDYGQSLLLNNLTAGQTYRTTNGLLCHRRGRHVHARKHATHSTYLRCMHQCPKCNSRRRVCAANNIAPNLQAR